MIIKEFDILIGVTVLEEKDGKYVLRVGGKKLTVTGKGLYNAIGLAFDEEANYDMNINTESTYADLAEECGIGEEEF